MKNNIDIIELINKLSASICIVNLDFTIEMVNDNFKIQSGLSKSKLIGSNLLDLYSDSREFLERKIKTSIFIESTSFSSWEQSPHIFPFKSLRKLSGCENKMYQNIEFIPIKNNSNYIDSVCICVYDFTEQYFQQKYLHKITEKLHKEHAQLEIALKKLKSAQSQLIQSEKMASVGILSAGIAHEINNPLSFVISNIQTLSEYFDDTLFVLSSFQSLIENTNDQKLIENKNKIVRDKNLDLIISDINDIVEESLDGASRVISIIKNLKEFTHIDESDWGYRNVLNGMESTLKIIYNQIKRKVNIVKKYDKKTPEIYCSLSQLNQVFLNLIINSCQAISKEEGVIEIKIGIISEEKIKISIIDNGSGIENKNLKKVFEPFFTTKEIGSGTGLGLSVSYGIIKKHKGNINVESELGQGTIFTIILPIHPTP